jgi:hypothetical protein
MVVACSLVVVFLLDLGLCGSRLLRHRLARQAILAVPAGLAQAAGCRRQPLVLQNKGLVELN